MDVPIMVAAAAAAAAAALVEAAAEATGNYAYLQKECYN